MDDQLRHEIEEFATWLEWRLHDGIEQDTPIALGETFTHVRKRIANLERMALDRQRLKKEVRDIAREKLYAEGTI